MNVHGGEKFRMKIVDRVWNDATKRQILETIGMQKIPEEHQMNSKSEWRATKIPQYRMNDERTSKRTSGRTYKDNNRQ